LRSILPITQAANYADQVAEIADLSAAVLFPCTSSSSSSAASEAMTAAAAGGSNPLFNTRALQLWVLRGCQQLKGGLRDKPGKSADYYHTCYCLSGLSAAQHIMGGCVVGPPAEQGGGEGGASSSSSNVLAAADPLLNVVVHKVAEAKRFFAEAAAVVL
jgi:prenyltransferase beta subunit